MAKKKRKGSRAVKLVGVGSLRTMVPAPEVMAALERWRRAYHKMLDEICKAALGLNLPGRDGTPYQEARIKGLSRDKMKAWLDDQVRSTAQGWQPKAPKLNVFWRDLKPSVIDAQDRLKAVCRATGREGYAILEAICSEGRIIASLAGQGRYGNRKTVSKKLRTALDDLGRHYGMWGAATGRRATQSVEYA